jgi:hypothetical protein
MGKSERLTELAAVIKGLAENSLTRHGLCVIIEDAPLILIKKKKDVIAFIIMAKDGICFHSDRVKSTIDLCSPNSDYIDELIEQAYQGYLSVEKRKLKRLGTF